jgi:hypothetical protein
MFHGLLAGRWWLKRRLKLCSILLRVGVDNFFELKAIVLYPARHYGVAVPDK